MIIKFYIPGEPSASFTWDLVAVPQIGSYLINHTEAGTFYYQVVNVCFVKESREAYIGKDYSSEGVAVGVKRVSSNDIP